MQTKIGLWRARAISKTKSGTWKWGAVMALYEQFFRAPAGIVTKGWCNGSDFHLSGKKAALKQWAVKGWFDCELFLCITFSVEKDPGRAKLRNWNWRMEGKGALFILWKTNFT